MWKYIEKSISDYEGNKNAFWHLLVGHKSKKKRISIEVVRYWCVSY